MYDTTLPHFDKYLTYTGCVGIRAQFAIFFKSYGVTKPINLKLTDGIE